MFSEYAVFRVWYWIYELNKVVSALSGEKPKTGGGMVIFGFSIVDMALMQDTVNQYAD